MKVATLVVALFAGRVGTAQTPQISAVLSKERIYGVVQRSFFFQWMMQVILESRRPSPSSSYA
jgi:hypothetical protein